MIDIDIVAVVFARTFVHRCRHSVGMHSDSLLLKESQREDNIVSCSSQCLAGGCHHVMVSACCRIVVF